jgi:hypothetical protein
LNHQKTLRDFLKERVFAVETTPRGLTATKGGQTANLYNFHGLTAIEGSQTASLYVVHGLTATKAGLTYSSSNCQNF